MSNDLGGARAASGMSLDAAIAALNDGLGDHDAAMTQPLTIEVDDTNTATLTIAQFVGNVTFKVTEGSPAPDGEITLLVPNAHADTSTLRRGNFNIVNDTGQAVRPQVSGQSEPAPSIAAGARAALTMDGANVYSVAAGADGGGASAMDDLSDVDLTTSAPSAGDVLMYDGTNWVPFKITADFG